MGGLGGVTTALGAILLKVFRADMAKGINNLSSNIKVITGVARKEAEETKTKMNNFLITMGEEQGSDTGTAMGDAYATRGKL
jgi:hypothetical protein